MLMEVLNNPKRLESVQATTCIIRLITTSISSASCNQHFYCQIGLIAKTALIRLKKICTFWTMASFYCVAQVERNPTLLLLLTFPVSCIYPLLLIQYFAACRETECRLEFSLASNKWSTFGNGQKIHWAPFYACKHYPIAIQIHLTSSDIDYSPNGGQPSCCHMRLPEQL